MADIYVAKFCGAEALVGDLSARSASALTEEAAAAARMATIRELGADGETAAGIVKNTKRIPAISGAAAYRIPDELGNGILGEVKNVRRPDYTKQLQDFAAYAAEKNLQFVMYVRADVEPTARLQAQFDSGAITPIYILK